MVASGADVAMGSRMLGKREKGSMSRLHYVGNILINIIISVICGKWITDSLTGLRVFKKEVIESLKLTSKGFEIETELTIKCLKRGFRIIEVPIEYYPRRGESRSKLKTLPDGLRILKTILLA